MSKYTVIADISTHICNILKKNMTPEPILNEDFIGVCQPNDKGDLILGVYLYDVKENQEIQSINMVNLGMNRQQYPPTYLSLYYMITAYSNTEVKTKYLDDQRIIGKAIQVLQDNSLINVGEITNSSNMVMPEAKIQLLSLDNEEKNKIWNFSNTPYRLSMCFQVSPAELESTKTRKVQRVMEVAAAIKENR